MKARHAVFLHGLILFSGASLTGHDAFHYRDAPGTAEKPEPKYREQLPTAANCSPAAHGGLEGASVLAALQPLPVSSQCCIHDEPMGQGKPRRMAGGAGAECASASRR